MRARRPRRRRAARQADAGPRPPGHEGVRLPQGPRRRRRPPRPRPPRPPPAARRRRHVDDGRAGTRRWPTPLPGSGRSPPSTAPARSAPTSATRRRSTPLASLHVAPLLRALGVRRTFSSGTQDCANKFVASEAVFGTSTVHPIPDLEHTDLCLVIGENPRASQASFYSIPNVLGELRRATARGARIVFVNPRRIETPDRGVGDTVLIRPDTDVWFLAALLHEIDLLGGFDARRHRPPRHARRRAAGVPRRVPGRPRRRRHGHRRRRRSASSPRRGSRRRGRRCTRRPGINMGRQGSLAYWLVHMLSFVTGRLDVEGGNLKSDGFYANAKSGAGRARAGLRRHRVRPAAPGRAARDADGRRHPRQRRAGPGDGRRRRQPAAVDRRPGAAAQGVRAARAARRHRHLPERHGRAGRRRAAVHRHVRARRPQHRQHRHQRPPVRPVHAGRRRAGARPQAGVVDRPPPAAGARRAVAAGRRDARPVGEVAPHAAARRRRRPRRPAGAAATRVVLPPPAPGEFFANAGVDRGRAGRLLPAVVRRRHRPLPRPVRRGRGRRRPAAPDPRARPVDAQHVVRQPAADEAARPDVQPAVRQPDRRRRARPDDRRPGARRRATTARSPPTSPSTTS